MNKIELYERKDMMLHDAFERIIVEIHLKKQNFGYKTFVFTGCNANAGTTTVSINLAIAMAKAGWKTILLDCDMRKIREYKRLNENSELGKGLEEFLADKCSVNDIVYETNQNNLSYIPSNGKNTEVINKLCSIQMAKLLKELNEKYDYIILDFPAVTSAIDANIIAGKADACILIAAMEETKKKQLNEAYNSLQQAGANVIGTILNKVPKKEYKLCVQDYDYYKMKKYMGKEKKKGN